MERRLASDLIYAGRAQDQRSHWLGEEEKKPDPLFLLFSAGAQFQQFRPLISRARSVPPRSLPARR
jgi:hypothetical protein